MINQQIVEVIVLSIVAVFLLFRLKSVLGYKNGHEKIVDPRMMLDRNIVGSANSADKVSKNSGIKESEDSGDDICEGLIEDESPMSEVIKKAKSIDNSVSLKDFFEGAKEAYKMLIAAYYEGDREPLSSYMSQEVFSEFDKSLDERQLQGMKCDFSYVYTRLAQIIDAKIGEDNMMDISVKLISDVILATYDKDGNVISGDPKKITKILDVWTFSRLLNSDSPRWVVTETSA